MTEAEREIAALGDKKADWDTSRRLSDMKAQRHLALECLKGEQRSLPEVFAAGDPTRLAADAADTAGDAPAATRPRRGLLWLGRLFKR